MISERLCTAAQRRLITCALTIPLDGLLLKEVAVQHTPPWPHVRPMPFTRMAFTRLVNAETPFLGEIVGLHEPRTYVFLSDTAVAHLWINECDQRLVERNRRDELPHAIFGYKVTI